MSEVKIEPAELGGSPLSRLAQQGKAPVDWYPPRPQTPDEWRIRAGSARRSLAGDWYQRIRPALGDSSGTKAAHRLARVVEQQGVVITTGQQPGLLGGPVYTWSKALSALAFADAFESETGIPAAPVFWAATDDSDFAEGAFTYLAHNGGLERVAIESSMPEGSRVADIPLSDMTAALEHLARACGSGADSRILELARSAYAEGATVGSSYVALLRSLLEPLGITVLDAAHESVSRAAHSTLMRALLDGERVARALATRSEALVTAGFMPQVPDVGALTLVFQRNGVRRERIARSRSAVAAATASPGSLSPNVLLRPVVERTLLPTIAYMAGPGEIAYFAQVSAVSGAIDIEPPLALPRWSATLIEPHIAEILQRYGLKLEDFSDPHAVETRLAREAWPSGVKKAMEELRRDLAQRLASVRSALASLDGLAPSASVDGTGRALEWRLSRLERRINAAVKGKEAALMHELSTARASLFPAGKRQERALNLLPILSRHGVGLLDEMRASATTQARSFLTPATESAIAT